MTSVDGPGTFGDRPGAELLSLLQFADGLFPAGGYAHSFGLESFVEAGQVEQAHEVEAFCRAYLEGSAGPCDAAAVVLARAFGQGEDLTSVQTLDGLLEAMKPVAESRQASRQMGRQTLRVAMTLTHHPLLRRAWAEVESGATPGHHPVVFGLVGATRSWSPLQAALAYLYSTAALLVGAALRLLPLGQLEGQRVLGSLGGLIHRLATAAGQTQSMEELWSFAPGVDIAGMRHAHLEARLFRS